MFNSCLKAPESNKIDNFAPNFRPTFFPVIISRACSESPIQLFSKRFSTAYKLPVAPLGGYLRVVLGHHISKNLLLRMIIIWVETLPFCSGHKTGALIILSQQAHGETPRELITNQTDVAKFFEIQQKMLA